MEFNFLHAVVFHSIIGILFSSLYLKLVQKYRKEQFEEFVFTEAQHQLFFLIIVLFYPVVLILEIRFLFACFMKATTEPIMMFIIKVRLRRILKKLIKIFPEDAKLKEELKKIKLF